MHKALQKWRSLPFMLSELVVKKPLGLCCRKHGHTSKLKLNIQHKDDTQWQKNELQQASVSLIHLKTAVHKRSPSNLTEPQLFFKEILARISVSRCAKLIET